MEFRSSGLLLFGLMLTARSLFYPVSSDGQSAASYLVFQQLSPDEIIGRFTSRESELREVWKEYIYRQETKLQVIGPAGTITGEFYQFSEFVFNDAGNRSECILKAPPSTLGQAGLGMTPEDMKAFIDLQPFALTREALSLYTLKYLGREKLDDLSTFVFEVTPKLLADAHELERARKQKLEGNRFQGKVWVDDQDFQIVKTAGKLVPEFRQRFPRFETYRENINGRYWLPTYTYGDDELVFEKGSGLHVRMVIRYQDYARFRGDVRILGDPGDESEADKAHAQAPKNAEKGLDKKIRPPQL